METKAVFDPDTKTYTVSGSKNWITNSPLADVFIIWAATHSKSGDKHKGEIRYVGIKLRQITRPCLAIHQKLATSVIIRVWTYEKVGRVIRLDPKLNTFIKNN